MGANTPRSVTPAIRGLCESLVDDPDIEFLDVEPVDGAATLDCFPVVEAHVASFGGAVCYGWRIWEMQWTYIEAEFHAVWENPSGALVDISSNQVGSSRVLFVRDSARTYEGRQVNNVRRALRSDSAIDEFFSAADAEFEFWNRGARAQQHGAIAISQAEAAELKRIQQRKARAMVAVSANTPKPGRNAPCPCGRGLKYKKCCGA